MTIRAPFQAHRGTNQVVTAAAAAASVTVAKVDKTVCVVNSGTTNKAYVRIGAGAQTATVADSVILPGMLRYFQKGDGEDTVSHISASGTTLEIQTGEGGF